MINLIPIEEKKRIRRDFYLRLLTVFFFALGFSLFVAAVSILPSFFFSSVKKNFAETKLDALQKEPVPTIDQETSSILKDLNGKLALIDKIEKEKFLVSQKVINEILLKKMPDIKITRIFYEENGKKISLKGIAPSRERLLEFRKALESDPSFIQVNLPISNFIKGSDIEFSLDMQIK